MVTPDTNSKGEFALWDNGKIIGYAKLVSFQNALVTEFIKPILSKMTADAFLDHVNLTLAVGYRPYSKQVQLRKQNVIDKTLVVKLKPEEYDKYILTAPSSAFSPVTAKPGYSNHSDGQAYDFNVTGHQEVYAWLVKHALSYGFIRTVPSERWHWEYRPGKDRFSVVPSNHPTWDHLV